MRMHALAVWIALSASQTGCLVGPDFVPPSVALSDLWRHTDESIHQDYAELAEWWFVFDDPTLDSLVAESLDDNLTLREAAYRIAEARFQRCIVRGDLFPQIDAEGSYMFQKTPTTGGLVGQFAGGGMGGGLGGMGFSIDDTINQWMLGLNGNWEIDLFGRLRRNLQAADSQYCASVWAYRDTMVLMLAEVATNYVDACAFQQRLEIARQNLKSQQRSLDIAQQKFEAGLTNELDVAQARANVATTQSEIPSLETGYQQTLNRLSVLLGDPPGYVDGLLTEVRPIPEPPQEIAVGIPADLLRRRPDIRQAEFTLAAQVAQIGVAVADLYPQLSLSGSFGVNSQELDQLFTYESISANVGPTVQWNILNFGRVRCNIAVQDALAAQNVAAYKNTVLEAAEEVDNSLIAYTREKVRLESLEQAVDANQRAVELAVSQYRQGTVDFQRVLDSQRQLLQTQDQFAVSSGNVSRNLIEIYRALGGGWQSFPPVHTPLIEEIPVGEPVRDTEIPDTHVDESESKNQQAPEEVEEAVGAESVGA